MHIALRIVWFLVVGWWLGPLWFFLASLLGVTVIWYNVGLFMILNTWDLMTLKKLPQDCIEDVRRVR